jgi:hypothetical protein
MKRYEPTLPRAAFGMAAAAMAALTMDLLVVVPAHLSYGIPDADRVAAQRTDTRAPVERAPLEVAIDPARIDFRIRVVAHRDPRKGFGLVRHGVRKEDAAKARTA